ncbi:QueT transporter family protein [Halobacillus sp. A1]|uniref:QueT transporter family protein n=1 Tax=Halobacillus sp. A1 TaxID=2880262 RepID=UPI0020A66A21|nr:QueT transporter family protein [Halobacillus sp. A1]MCP3032590.1 QueT transporter family protein [Halobacillus sp. A1]
MAVFTVLNIVGGITFAAVLILFILAFKYDITKGRLKKHHIIWGSTALTVVAIAAALNAGAAILTGPIRFGWISFRPGAAITPVLGIVFGIPGAFGAALGNLISDIFKGFVTPASLGGVLGNFLFAYIPYKIMKDFTLKTFRSWSQFVVGVVGGALLGMLVMPFVISITGTLPTEVAWTTEPTALLMNRIVAVLILGPIFLKLLYPIVKRQNLDWQSFQGKKKINKLPDKENIGM